MKKILGILALFVLVASQVWATDLDITPGVVNMQSTDTAFVDVCLKYSNGSAWSGATLAINTWCKDLNDNTVCDAGDEATPATFTPTVEVTPTGADGCGKVRLETNNAEGGTYAYLVNGLTAGGAFIAAEHGLVFVPEFGVVAAGLALAGAGVYIARKRKQ